MNNITLNVVLGIMKYSHLEDLTKKKVFTVASVQGSFTRKAISGAIGRALEYKYIRIINKVSSVCDKCERIIGPPQHIYEITDIGSKRLMELNDVRSK